MQNQNKIKAKTKKKSIKIKMFVRVFLRFESSYLEGARFVILPVCIRNLQNNKTFQYLSLARSLLKLGTYYQFCIVIYSNMAT